MGIVIFFLLCLTSTPRPQTRGNGRPGLGWGRRGRQDLPPDVPGMLFLSVPSMAWWLGPLPLS